MARVTESMRKRRAKKLREQGGPRPAPDPQQVEKLLLRADRRRAFSERGLLMDTKFRTNEISVRRIRELSYLFRLKQSLPQTQTERDADDQSRRAAVVEIIQARVKAGIDPDGEEVKWTEKGADITNGLRRKLSEYFTGLGERKSALKSQRKFLHWCLNQPQRSGIPPNSIEWLRSIINKSAGLSEKGDMVANMRAVYFMLACAATVGVMIEPEFGEDFEENARQTHEWLIQQPREFFEDDNFNPAYTYPILLDPEGIANWAEGALGDGRQEAGEEQGSEGDSLDEDSEEAEEQDQDQIPPLPMSTTLPIRNRSGPLLVNTPYPMMQPEPVSDEEL